MLIQFSVWFRLYGARLLSLQLTGRFLYAWLRQVFLLWLNYSDYCKTFRNYSLGFATALHFNPFYKEKNTRTINNQMLKNRIWLHYSKQRLTNCSDENTSKLFYKHIIFLLTKNWSAVLCSGFFFFYKEHRVAIVAF